MILFALLQRLLALASVAVLGASLWLIWSWWDRERQADLLGLEDPSDGRLLWGLGLLALSLLGRLPSLLVLGRGGGVAPTRHRDGATIAGPDGAALNVEVEGAATGPIILLTHGWGMSSRIWADTRAALADRFGVVAWDLPGAGLSSRPGAWSLEGFADDLKAGGVIRQLNAMTAGVDMDVLDDEAALDLFARFFEALKTSGPQRA